MVAASISKRKHIRWLPDPAIEHTSTIVLSTPKSNYVDIRLNTKGDHPEGIRIPSLEWAFAGISHTTGIHTEWIHHIDSKTDDPAKDEGEMSPHGLDTLERGRMINPDTGVETEYEELWTELEIEKAEDEECHVCMTLTLDSKNAKGMIIRVGGFCEGLLKVWSDAENSRDMTIERWQWIGAQSAAADGEGSVPDPDRVQNMDSKGWTRVFRSGNRHLPCDTTWTSMKDLKIRHVETADGEWVRAEFYRWQ